MLQWSHGKKQQLSKSFQGLYIYGEGFRYLTYIPFFIFIYFNKYEGLDIVISVISSLANSGLTLVKSDNDLSLYFLLLTIIGGSLISNTSGIKLTRFYILLKITSLEIIKLISPNSVINKTIFNSDRKITDDNVKISFLIFISFFLSLFILSSLLGLPTITVPVGFSKKGFPMGMQFIARKKDDLKLFAFAKKYEQVFNYSKNKPLLS